MKARLIVLALTLVAVPGSAVFALTSPSASDGPIKLLSCIVSPNGVLEAQVDNQGDDAMFCNIRCHYDIGGKTFSHQFSETIPKRFQGRLSKFDTNGAKPGNYSGEVGTCKKVSS